MRERFMLSGHEVIVNEKKKIIGYDALSSFFLPISVDDAKGTFDEKRESTFVIYPFHIKYIHAIAIALKSTMLYEFSAYEDLRFKTLFKESAVKDVVLSVAENNNLELESNGFGEISAHVITDGGISPFDSIKKAIGLLEIKGTSYSSGGLDEINISALSDNSRESLVRISQLPLGYGTAIGFAFRSAMLLLDENMSYQNTPSCRDRSNAEVIEIGFSSISIGDEKDSSLGYDILSLHVFTNGLIAPLDAVKKYARLLRIS